MNPFTALKSQAVLLLVNDIDTDQIIPARYLKGVDKKGFGEKLFADWRYLADGTPNPEFVLNKPENKDAKILVAGENFGCGSSREHAPWALLGFGFRAVISTRFADIFSNNALKNGLLPVKIDTQSHQVLVHSLKTAPQGILKIDLEAQTLSLPDGKQVSFPISEFSKTCLLNGVDELGYLLGLNEQITGYEQSMVNI